MARAANFHEDLRRSKEVASGSDRSLGFVFAAVLTLYGLLPLRTGAAVRLPALGGAVVFLAAALIYPHALHPLNIAWSWIGVMLGRIVSPIVTTILFFLVFAPAGIIMRLCGRDPLRLKPARGSSTYWIVRDPPGPRPESMAKPF